MGRARGLSGARGTARATTHHP
ncbi:hypothetical protein STRIP9103_06985, partial [Streptomyces ipomoeae 91-03]